jgi:hypothetical protein
MINLNEAYLRGVMRRYLSVEPVGVDPTLDVLRELPAERLQVWEIISKREAVNRVCDAATVLRVV